MSRRAAKPGDGRFQGSRTPASITPTVLHFCARLQPESTPVFLRVRPEAESLPLACFDNVRRKVEARGGRCEVGWAIWLWPRVYIEAEHHAVYAPAGGGAWQDLTPARDPATKRRLFLPDAAATFDPLARRDNVRMALSDDPHVATLLAGAAERARIWATMGGGAEANARDFASLQSAELAQGHAQLRLAMTHTPPNAPCSCGSGRRFRRCHGRR